MFQNCLLCGHCVHLHFKKKHFKRYVFSYCLFCKKKMLREKLIGNANLIIPNNKLKNNSHGNRQSLATELFLNDRHLNELRHIKNALCGYTD